MPTKPTPIQSSCQYCSVTFYKLPEKTNRFCGVACSNKSRTQPIDVRFWSKVNKNGPIPAHRPELGQCWPWTGCDNPDGYGAMRVNGRMMGASRVSWMVHTGNWPTRMTLHKCDYPPCVRFDHLFEGDQQINSDDKISKGRGNWPTKVSDDKVRAIRAMNGTMTHAEIGLIHGISGRYVSRIINRTRKAHVI